MLPELTMLAVDVEEELVLKSLLVEDSEALLNVAELLIVKEADALLVVTLRKVLKSDVTEELSDNEDVEALLVELVTLLSVVRAPLIELAAALPVVDESTVLLEVEIDEEGEEVLLAVWDSNAVLEMMLVIDEDSILLVESAAVLLDVEDSTTLFVELVGELLEEAEPVRTLLVELTKALLRLVDTTAVPEDAELATRLLLAVDEETELLTALTQTPPLL